MDIDGAPYIAFEAGVEETRRVLECGASGEGQLDLVLVGFVGADDAVVLPYRDAAHAVRRLSPFHFLDYVRVGLPDQRPYPRQRVVAPVIQLFDRRIDRPRGRRFAFW